MVIDSGQNVTIKRDAGKRRQLAAGPRRGYDMDFKLQVLNEILAPDASVAAVARRHGMNTNVIFRWRKLFREGRLTDSPGADNKKLPPPVFVPVKVMPDAAPMPRALPAPQILRRAAAPEEKSSPHKKSGVMTITLPGGFTLRVDTDIDEAALRRALRAVKELS